MEYLDEAEEDHANSGHPIEINQDIAGAMGNQNNLAGASSGAEKNALVQKISLSNQSLLDQLERLTQATR